MDISKRIEELSENPELLHDTNPREFEQIVAELLASFGWQVNVTPASKDGGYDILGITTDGSELQTSWAVECKKYRKDRKIGVELIRQLLGVKEYLGIPNAVLVTTSGFTSGAMEIGSSRQDVQLVDFHQLQKWFAQHKPKAGSSYSAESTFSSCFISYSSGDEEFAQKFAANMRNAGIRVWFALDDIAPGAKIYSQIKEAIFSFDRVLVILSKNSLNSHWVKTELSSALSRQHREGRNVLYPISIMPISELKAWEYMDSDSGVDIARELRSFHIPDFSNWRDGANFKENLDKVVKSLRNNTEPNTSLPSLSKEAVDVLIEAGSETYGRVMIDKTAGGTMISTSNRTFVQSIDRRVLARWESALEELVSQMLLKPVGHKGEIYEMTDLGYKIADMVGK